MKTILKVSIAVLFTAMVSCNGFDDCFISPEHEGACTTKVENSNSTWCERMEAEFCSKGTESCNADKNLWDWKK